MSEDQKPEKVRTNSYFLTFPEPHREDRTLADEANKEAWQRRCSHLDVLGLGSYAPQVPPDDPCHQAGKGTRLCEPSPTFPNGSNVGEAGIAPAVHGVVAI